MNMSQLPQRWGGREQRRWILLWGVLSTASVIIVLVLFLCGAVVVEEIKTKSLMFSAGSFALLVTVAPALCLVYRIFRYKCDSQADIRDSSVYQRPQIDSHNPVTIAVSRSDYQPSAVCHTIGDQDFHEVNSPTSTNIDPPPSYESVMGQTDFRRENDVVSRFSSVEIAGDVSSNDTRTVATFLGSFLGSISTGSSAYNNTTAAEVLSPNQSEAGSTPPTYSSVVY